MGREDKHFFTFRKIINILLLKMKLKNDFLNAFYQEASSARFSFQAGIRQIFIASLPYL
jgi:hypothetical protein